MMVCQSAPPASAPEPRLTARSMLSFGTEVFLAFWMASYSVGLPAGSPPPVRAATSMFLISLAKFLPLRASMIAFLCLVVAHLEWPLMQVLPLSILPLVQMKSDQRVYVDVYAAIVCYRGTSDTRGNRYARDGHGSRRWTLGSPGSPRPSGARRRCRRPRACHRDVP